jgi:hypothetical protein
MQPEGLKRRRKAIGFGSTASAYFPLPDLQVECEGGLDLEQGIRSGAGDYDY